LASPSQSCLIVSWVQSHYCVCSVPQRVVSVMHQEISRADSRCVHILQKQ
jgi:hypothetical protein